MNDRELQRYTQIVAAGAAFISPFVGSSINLAIPSIGIHFSSTASMLSWIVSSFLLCSVSFSVPFGSLGDATGRKRILKIGLAIFTLASFGGGFAWSMSSLLFFRIAQGLGASMVFGTSVAILTTTFPPEQRGKVLGTNVAAVYTGLAMGPVLGGALNHYFGWHSIFYFCGTFTLIVLIIALLKLPNEDQKPTNRFDYLGSILYTIAICALLSGLSLLPQTSLAWFLVAFGLLFSIAFIMHELKIDFPVMPLRLFFRNRVFAYANLGAMINYCATFAINFLLSIYLQTILGYDSQIAGFIILAQALVMIVISPFSGIFSDRTNPLILGMAGMIIINIGLLIFVFIGYTTPIALIIFNLILIGAGTALFASPNTNMVLGSVDKQFSGVASSTISTMRMAGQAFSMVIVTMVLGWFIGQVELAKAPHDELLAGIKYAYAIFTFINALGILALLQCRTPKLADSKS